MLLKNLYLDIFSGKQIKLKMFKLFLKEFQNWSYAEEIYGSGGNKKTKI